MSLTLASRRNVIWLVALVVATALLTLYFVTTQPPLTASGGRGWDGVHYADLAERIAAGDSLRGVPPVIYRIGTPLLVAVISKLGFATDVVQGFRSVNLVFGFLSVLLVYGLIAQYVDRRWALLAALLYAAHWVGPIRLVAFSPVLTDPPALFLFFGGLLLSLKLRSRPIAHGVFVSGAVLLGVMFREANLVLCLIIALAQRPPGEFFAMLRNGAWHEIVRSMRPALLPTLAGIAGLLFVRAIVTVDPSVSESYGSYGFLSAALFHLWINSPQYFSLAILANFGLFVLFPILRARQIATYANEHPMLLWSAASTLALAYVGGFDVERYVNVAWPFAAIIIIKAIEYERPNRLLVVLMIGFALVFVARVLWAIPDYASSATSPTPIFTFLTESFRFLDLYVLHSDKLQSGKAFYQYLATLLMLAVLLRWRRLVPMLGWLGGRSRHS